MKKYLSLLLALSKVLSLVGVPAQAAVTGVDTALNSITNGVIPTGSGKWIYNVDGNTVTQPTDGLGGKAADDAYSKIANDGSKKTHEKSPRAGLIMVNKNDTYFTKNYFVYSVDVYGDTPFTFIMRNTSTGNVYIGAKGDLQENQWNNFVVVYDRVNYTAQVYINDTAFGSAFDVGEAFRDGQLRLQLTDTTIDYYYIDNIAIYATDTAPTFDGAGSGATGGGSGDDTEPEEPEVPIPATVFEKRTDESTSDFTVVGDAYDFDIDSTSTAAYGIGGKAATDSVGKLTGIANDDNALESFFIRTNATELINAKKDFVMSIMVYPNPTIGGMAFTTTSGKALSKVVNTTVLPEGKWSRISLVHDVSANKSDLYVNDVYMSTTTCSAGTSLRVRFDTTTASLDEASIYYDDYYIYSGNMTVPTVSGFGDYVVEGIYINNYGDAIVSDIKETVTLASENYSAKVVGSSGQTLADTADVESGCELHIYEGETLISKYIFGIKTYEISADTKLASNGYISEDNKFAKGEITITRDFTNYGADKNVFAIAAQYKTDGTLIKTNVSPQAISGADRAEVTLNVTETDGTYIKFMLLDPTTLKPLASSATFSPFEQDIIESAQVLYKGYTTKSMVFNYDDSDKNDKPLIDLLNTYGMKGTFNIVSSRLIKNFKSYVGDSPTDAQVLAYAKELYTGHEIANHTDTHPYAHKTPEENATYGITSEDLIAQINTCDTFAYTNFGTNTIALAWPAGPATRRADYDTYILPALKNNTNIKFARYHENGSFDLPDDWYRWNSTCHHNDAPYFTDKFVALENEGDLKCFFNWGHSYEFKDNEGDDNLDWTMIENVMKKLQNEDIWFATNGDVYNYVEASKLVEKTDTTIKNNSTVPLYFSINGENVTIAAGATYDITE